MKKKERQSKEQILFKEFDIVLTIQTSIYQNKNQTIIFRFGFNP